MNVLLTGAGGFSGSHIYNYLFNSRPDISVKTLPGFDLSTDDWKGLYWREFDAIIHTAAVSPGEGVSSGDLIRNINITKNVIRIAQLTKVKKIINFSSASRYGEVQTSILTTDNPIINPSIYGMTKAICEELLKESGIPTVSLQLPLIIGKDCKRNWIARMQETIKLGKEVSIYNPYTPFNNAVHIDFLCQLVGHLLDNNKIDKYIPTLICSVGEMEIHEVVDKIVYDRVPIRSILTNRPGHTISTVNMFCFPFIGLEPWTIEKTIDKYVEDER